MTTQHRVNRRPARGHRLSLYRAAQDIEPTPPETVTRIRRLIATQPHLQHADIARALQIDATIVRRVLDD